MRGARGGGRFGRVAVPWPEQAAATESRARLPDTGRRGRHAGEVEQPRAGRAQRGRALRGPLQKRRRRAVVCDAPALHRDDTIDRAEAALETVLGEQDRRLPLLVQPPQQADQLVAGDGVQLRERLVEQDHARPTGECRPERDPLLLAPGQLVCAAIEQTVDAERERDLLHAPCHRRPRASAAFERERQLGAHGAHDELRLGVLEECPDRLAQARRSVLASV